MKNSFGFLLITPEGRRLLGDIVVNMRILKKVMNGY
jgi:hypothetical protein